MLTGRKKTFVLSIGFLIGCVVLTLSALLSFEPEPTYKGKPLSHWLLVEHETGGNWAFIQSTEAAEAVRKTGTNAVPQLLKWISYSKPNKGVAECLCLLAGRRVEGLDPESFRTTIVMHMRPVQRTLFPALASDGFRTLGTNAATAVPELAKLMTNTNDPEIARLATQAICWLGKDAVPPLIAALTNTNIRGYAVRSVQGMKYLDEDTKPLIPVLIQCSQDQDERFSDAAFGSLCFLKIDPQNTLPVLGRALADNSRKEFFKRIMAIECLGEWGTNARPYIPDLIKIIKTDFDRDSFRAGYLGNGPGAEAAEALGNLALAPEICVPALIESLDSRDELKIAAMKALPKFGSVADAAFPKILEIAKKDIPHTRRRLDEMRRDSDVRPEQVKAAAIEALGNLRMEPQLVFPVFKDGLDFRAARQASIEAFGKFGPAAKDYAAILKPALYDGDPAVKKAVTNALQSIAPEVLTNGTAR